MKKKQKLLRAFLTDILENHLSQYVQEELEIMKEEQVPLLEKLDLDEREYEERATESARKFLKDLMAGHALETLKQTLSSWEKDELPGIPKDSIQPDDLILIFNTRKKGLIHFIPQFTKDSSEVVQLYTQLDNYFIRAQQLAFEKLFKIQKESERKLKMLNEDLKSFNYSVSHDLRAPLRAVHGYAKVVIEDYEDELQDEVVDLLHIIMQNSRRMGRLIDDLLEFSRVGRREIEKQPVDMTKLVQRIIREQKSKQEVSLDVQVGQLPEAEADTRMMQQVWTNLVTNAMKFTQQEEQPKIVVEGRQNADTVTYLIKDNGVGFDMQYADKLFTVFQRLHSQKKFEGTGVGLSMVKRIVNKHKGKIWAEAVENKGATFYFSLPK